MEIDGKSSVERGFPTPVHRRRGLSSKEDADLSQGEEAADEVGQGVASPREKTRRKTMEKRQMKLNVHSISFNSFRFRSIFFSFQWRTFQAKALLHRGQRGARRWAGLAAAVQLRRPWHHPGLPKVLKPRHSI